MAPASPPPLAAAASAQQQAFGLAKSGTLPAECKQCPYLFACHGECPKNRFVRSADGQAGLNYLCPGLKAFFTHIDPWMKRMAAEVLAGRPAANVMQKRNQPQIHADSRRYGKQV